MLKFFSKEARPDDAKATIEAVYERANANVQAKILEIYEARRRARLDQRIEPSAEVHPAQMTGKADT